MAQVISFNNHNLELTDHNGQQWMTATQIGEALEFAEPRKSINNLYNSYKDEFNGDLTCVIETVTQGQKRKLRVFNRRGAWLIGLFARTKIAKEFRVWVLNVLEETADAEQPSLELSNNDGFLLPSECQLVKEFAIKAHERTELPYPQIYARLQNKMRVNSYLKLKREQLTDALLYLATMESKQKALPAPEQKNNTLAIISWLELCILQVNDIHKCFGRGDDGLHSHTLNLIGNLQTVTDLLGEPRRFLAARVVPNDVYQMATGKSKMLAVS